MVKSHEQKQPDLRREIIGHVSTMARQTLLTNLQAKETQFMPSLKKTLGCF